MFDSSLTADRLFRLDGAEPLGHTYDDEADVLYLWRGEAPREALGLTTSEGHVVRVDETSGEIVGFTIFNWGSVWSRTGRPLEIDVPSLDAAERTIAACRHELTLVAA